MRQKGCTKFYDEIVIYHWIYETRSNNNNVQEKKIIIIIIMNKKEFFKYIIYYEVHNYYLNTKWKEI